MFHFKIFTMYHLLSTLIHNQMHSFLFFANFYCCHYSRQHFMIIFKRQKLNVRTCWTFVYNFIEDVKTIHLLLLLLLLLCYECLNKNDAPIPSFTESSVDFCNWRRLRSLLCQHIHQCGNLPFMDQCVQVNHVVLEFYVIKCNSIMKFWH